MGPLPIAPARDLRAGPGLLQHFFRPLLRRTEEFRRAVPIYSYIGAHTRQWVETHFRLHAVRRYAVRRSCVTPIFINECKWTRCLATS